MKDPQKVFDKIKNAKNMPSLPQVLLKLIEACNNDEITSKELSKIISKDPSLSAKVMRILHSPYSGLNNRVNSIQQAVIYLGVDTIKNIAVSASVQQVFGYAKESPLFKLNQFWWHSFLCATFARRIAKRISYNSPEEAFLAGLLHDIGKLVFWVNFQKQYAEILKQSKKNDELLIAEKVMIGANHCEVGAWLVEQWKLNAFISDAIYYHHEPLERIIDSFPLIKIIYVSNRLCEGFFEEELSAREAAKKIFDFSSSELDEIMSSAKEEVTNIARSFDIHLDLPEEEIKVVEKDLEKQKKLLNEVRNISLLYGTLQNLLKADNRTAILEITRYGLEILFNIKRSVFFLYEPEHHLLTGIVIPKGSRHPINNLTLSLNNDHTLIIRSLCKGTILDSFGLLTSEKQSIADEQIIKLLGSEGMLCVPMLAHQKFIGVIVMGLSKFQFRQLSDHLKLLSMFAKHVAWCLHVDEVKQNQARIIYDERMEACVKFARELVHEVNNPLNIIKNYLKILGLKLPDKSDALNDLKIIGEEIDRVAELIKNLYDFSKPEVKHLELLDINLILSNLLQILSKAILIPSKIKVQFFSDPSLPKIVSDENGLKQVFMNLIKNAAEAMPKGGTITIRTGTVEPSDLDLGGVDRSVLGSIKVTIRDNGPGIPDQIMARLFEPFTTTKGAGHSGLGLSIVHSIIRELNGSITCQSHKDVGTTFTIILPLSCKSR